SVGKMLTFTRARLRSDVRRTRATLTSTPLVWVRENCCSSSARSRSSRLVTFFSRVDSMGRRYGKTWDALGGRWHVAGGGIVPPLPNIFNPENSHSPALLSTYRSKFPVKAESPPQTTFIAAAHLPCSCPSSKPIPASQRLKANG